MRDLSVSRQFAVRENASDDDQREELESLYIVIKILGLLFLQSSILGFFILFFLWLFFVSFAHIAAPSFSWRAWASPGDIISNKNTNKSRKLCRRIADNEKRLARFPSDSPLVVSDQCLWLFSNDKE